MTKLTLSLALGFGLHLGVSPSAAWAAPPRAPDFDGDGDTDLVVGVPGQNTRVPGGMAFLYGGYGDPGGYRRAYTHFDQSVPNMPGTAEPQDRFGAALAWGDFDADGYDDLVIGVPGDLYYGESVGGIEVLYGADGSLINSRARVITRRHGGIAGAGLINEDFGAALAAGDFNGDGYDDLAVGAPAYRIPGNSGGSVQVFYGSATGLSTNIILEDSGDDGSHMGSSLTTGDFNCDGYEDLAIGSPARTVNGKAYAGLIHVAYGQASGLPTIGFQMWTQNGAGGSVSEAYDVFGHALAAGNFNDDSVNGRPCVDLAISAPGQNINGVGAAGAVHVLRGGSGGLTSTNAAYLHQDQPSVGSSCVAGDSFGQALAISRLDNDSYDDLIVGAVGESSTAGGVHIFTGGSALFDLNEDMLWTQASAPSGIAIPGAAESNDLFGSAIGGGAFGPLVVAAPHEDINFEGVQQINAGFAVSMTFQNTSTVTINDIASWDTDGFVVETNDGQLFGASLTGARPGFVW